MASSTPPPTDDDYTLPACTEPQFPSHAVVTYALLREQERAAEEDRVILSQLFLTKVAEAIGRVR